jgi:hypothetical protein
MIFDGSSGALSGSGTNLRLMAFGRKKKVTLLAGADGLGASYLYIFSARI